MRRSTEPAADTPLTNLHVSVLGKLGVPVEQFGNSTCKLEYLSQIQAASIGRGCDRRAAGALQA